MKTCTTIPLCPFCKEPMVLRTNHATAKPFWGCSEYPECRGSRNADGSRNRRRTVGDEYLYPDGPDEDFYENEEDQYMGGDPSDYGDN